MGSGGGGGVYSRPVPVIRPLGRHHQLPDTHTRARPRTPAHTTCTNIQRDSRQSGKHAHPDRDENKTAVAERRRSGDAMRDARTQMHANMHAHARKYARAHTNTPRATLPHSPTPTLRLSHKPPLPPPSHIHLHPPTTTSTHPPADPPMHPPTHPHLTPYSCVYLPLSSTHLSNAKLRAHRLSFQCYIYVSM